MSNLYNEMQQRHQNQINNFPCFFAFNEMQLGAGLKKLGLKRKDMKKLCRGFGGMFYLKSDAKLLQELLHRFDEEKSVAIASDATGEGFIYDMFSTELANHEFSYTQDATEAIDACGLTVRQVLDDVRLLHGLEKACSDLMAWNKVNG